MDIEFKKLHLEDWKFIEALEKSMASYMFKAFDGEKDYKKYLQESKVFGIMIDDKVIGSISYKEQDNGDILIDGLTVMSEYRNRGIASSAIVKLFQEVGNKNYKLTVHPGKYSVIACILAFRICNYCLEGKLIW
jgi:predicted acetyltransferase